MTVVARRPIYYVVSRDGGELHIRVEPGTLLAAEPTGPVVVRTPSEVTGGAKAPKARGPRGESTSPIQGEQLVPKVSMPALRKGEGLTVDAEHLSTDEEKNELVAQGHVTIARAGSLLTADEVRINRDTQRAEAKGNVQFTDPQGTIQAGGFAGNLEDETGELTDGTVYLSSNHLTISGEKIEKSFGQTYHIENGEFTTCQCGAGAPSWSIAGKSVDITLDGYGLVDRPKLKVLDTPILYLPYLSFPAKKTRQTGLLSPLYGYSKKRGFTYLQPIYVVLNKSVDFTVAPDIATSARLGAIGEVRYAIDERSKGVSTSRTSTSSFATTRTGRRRYERRQSDDPAEPLERDGRHSSGLAVRAARVRRFSGRLRRLLPARDADGIVRSGICPDAAHQSLRYDARRALPLLGPRDADQPGRLFPGFRPVARPDVSAVAAATVLHLGSLPRSSSEARHGDDFTDFVRKQGFDGPRLDLNPQAEVPFRWKEYLNGSIGLQGRETAYHMNNTDLLLADPAPGVERRADAGADTGSRRSRRIRPASSTRRPRCSARNSLVPSTSAASTSRSSSTRSSPKWTTSTFRTSTRTISRPTTSSTRSTAGTSSPTGSRAACSPSSTVPRRSTRDGRCPYGDLNSFSGVKPSPFGGEDERGGLASLGNPSLSGSTPSGIGVDTDETQKEGAEGMPRTDANQSAEERAARRAEEKSAVSNVVEWARLQIFQSYDIRDSLQSTTGPDPNDHFSDVDVHMRLRPHAAFNLIYDSTVNARDARLTSASVGVVLRDPRQRSTEGFLRATERASLGVSYRFISDQTLKEVDGGIVVPLADTLSTFYQTRYDALAGIFLEKTGGFRLTSQCQCWIADLSVSDLINPPETQLRFQVTLVGLGSIGRTR